MTGLRNYYRKRWAGVFATALMLSLAAAACSSSNSSNSGAAAASGSATAAAVGSSSYPPIPSGPIKVGALYPLSGPLAALGKTHEEAEEAFINKLNAAGGIAGHQIDFVVGNDQGDPTVAVQQAKNLISQGVKAVLYEGTTVSLVTAVQVFQAAGVPMLMATPLDKFDGVPYSYFFNFLMTDNPQMVALASYAKEEGYTKVGILGDGTPFALELTQDFKNAAPKDGITITASTAYSTTAVDVTSQVDALKASGAKALVVTAETGLNYIWTALHAIGWNPPILTNGAVVDYTDGLGSLANATVTTCAQYAGSATQEESQLAAAVKIAETATGAKAANANDVTPFGDEIYALKYAIEKENSVDPKAIVAGMETISNQSFTTPQDSYTFTAAQHSGLNSSAIKVCYADKLGPNAVDIVASS